MSTWVQLSEEQARKHPAFGIKGVANLFCLLQLIIPIIGLVLTWASMGEFYFVHGNALINHIFWIPPLVNVFWSGYNAILLEKRSPQFREGFIWFMFGGPLITALCSTLWATVEHIPLGMEIDSLALSLFPWVIWAAIWVPYVLFSERLNVTLLHITRVTDPYLKTIGK